MVWPLLRFMAGRSSGFMGYTQAANSTESDGPAWPPLYVHTHVCVYAWSPGCLTKYISKVFTMYLSKAYIWQNLRSNLQIFVLCLRFCQFKFASCVLELGHIRVSTQMLIVQIHDGFCANYCGVQMLEQKKFFCALSGCVQIVNWGGACFCRLMAAKHGRYKLCTVAATLLLYNSNTNTNS